MMKRIFAGMLLSTLFVAVEANDTGYMHLMKRVRGFGQSIERVDNIPLIDKLTNLLPFAMVAACLKECPGQTLMVLTGLLVYTLLANDKFRSTLRKYNPFMAKRLAKSESQFDDSLFVFDGEGQEDMFEDVSDEVLMAEMLQNEIDEEILEEEILEEEIDEELFFDEYSDVFRSHDVTTNSCIKFL